MITTDTLRAQLKSIGTLVAEGDLTFRSPAIIEPFAYPKTSGPKGAQVRVWLTSMKSGTALLRIDIPLHGITGKFTEAEITTAIARENRAQSFGSLKVWVLKGRGARIFKGDLLYAAPVTANDAPWLPEVVTRLLNVWQDTMIAVRNVAWGATTRGDSDEPLSEKAVRKESASDILDELDALVGMQPVKDAVRRLVATQDIAQKRMEIGLHTSAPSPHLVFTGNPGTGKTTVARMIGRLYRSLGLLSSGHVVEVGRAELVGGYVGQTALKTKAVCESALGGVLFIDEAYSLHGGSGIDFGHEAVETLLTFMETNRGKIVVVAAGYPEEMASFISMNPGLASRFDITVDFPDYSDLELARMLERMFRMHDYHVRDTQMPVWQGIFRGMTRGRGFGNAREVRRIFHEIVTEEAVLLADRGVLGDHDLWNISSKALRTVSKRHRADPEPEPVSTRHIGYL